MTEKLCPKCKLPYIEESFWTSPEGNGTMYVHGHESRGRKASLKVHYKVGCVVMFDKEEVK
jgi:uncharacterized protein (AIM24 family)